MCQKCHEPESGVLLSICFYCNFCQGSPDRNSDFKVGKSRVLLFRASLKCFDDYKLFERPLTIRQKNYENEIENSFIGVRSKYIKVCLAVVYWSQVNGDMRAALGVKGLRL